MVCRSMLASDSGEMDSALFLLSRGVSRGLEKRDTAHREEKNYLLANKHVHSLSDRCPASHQFDQEPTVMCKFPHSSIKPLHGLNKIQHLSWTIAEIFSPNPSVEVTAMLSYKLSPTSLLFSPTHTPSSPI